MKVGYLCSFSIYTSEIIMSWKVFLSLLQVPQYYAVYKQRALFHVFLVYIRIAQCLLRPQSALYEPACILVVGCQEFFAINFVPSSHIHKELSTIARDYKKAAIIDWMRRFRN